MAGPNLPGALPTGATIIEHVARVVDAARAIDEKARATAAAAQRPTPAPTPAPSTPAGKGA